MSTFAVCGYALVWGAMARIGDQVEVVLKGALDQQGIRDVPLYWGMHDTSRPAFARSARGTLALFSDDVGLGFRASIAFTQEGAAAIHREVGRGRVQGASVCFGPTFRGYEDNGLRVIKSATIEHIVLTDDPAYASTSAWLEDNAHDDFDLAPRLRPIARQWARGFAAHNQRKRVSLPVSSTGPVSREVHRPRQSITAPPSLIALMNSAAWRDVAGAKRQA